MSSRMGDYGSSYNHVAAGGPGYVGDGEYEDWSWMHNTRTADNAGRIVEVGEHDNDEWDGVNGGHIVEVGEHDNDEWDGVNAGHIVEVGEHVNDEWDGVNYEAEYNGVNYGAEYNGVNYEAEYSYTQVEGATTSSGYGHRRVLSASGDRTGFWHLEEKSSESSEEDEPAKEKTEKKKKKKNKNLQLVLLREPTDTHSDPGYGDDTSSQYARSQSIDLVSSWLQDASLGESAPRAPPARRPPPRRHPRGADMVTRSAPLPNQNAAGHYEENQLDLYDSTPGSNVYRLEEKPVDRALKMVRTKAAGFASVSKAAAENIKQRSIEFTTTTVIPIMKPLLNAVVEESKNHINLDGIFDPPGGPNSQYGPAPGSRGGRGRRGGPMPRPMYGRPPMMRGMPLGPRPVMRPGMMPRPMIRPGMRPPPPGAMAARGQGVVAVRGQPRPRGRARPVAPPGPTW